MNEQLVETWQIHCRVGHYLLDAMADDALSGKALKGRTVAAQLAHIHNTRLMWLKEAAPELLAQVSKLEGSGPFDRATLGAALAASDEAMTKLIEAGLAAGRVKGFKPHPVAFVGYLIAHESFHRGDIGVRLTELGHPLDRKTDFGMWAWGVR